MSMRLTIYWTTLGLSWDLRAREFCFIKAYVLDRKDNFSKKIIP
jgi:hypothetical protein